MEAETFFYIVGATLTAAALVLSFIGLRSESFPSTAAMRVLLPLFVLLVAGSAVGAVLSARAEQSERREHLSELAAEEEEEAVSGGEAVEETEGTGEAEAEPPAEEEPGGGEPAPSEGGDELETLGAQVFADQGCGSCHTLTASDATGQVGPNLDETLEGQSAEFIRTSIVDPEAEIAEGFPAGTMPSNYGDQLSGDELQALVAYLEFAVATN